MPYYVRTFCKSPIVPTLSEVETALKSDFPSIRIETDDAAPDSQFDFMHCFYKEENHPLVVECNYNDGPESLCAEECQEFIERIEDLDDSPGKQKVIDHLKNTKYIICVQMLSDIDEDGYLVDDALYNFFVTKYEGMFQADAEGFYGDNGLILEC